MPEAKEIHGSPESRQEAKTRGREGRSSGHAHTEFPAGLRKTLTRAQQDWAIRNYHRHYRVKCVHNMKEDERGQVRNGVEDASVRDKRALAL